MRILVSLYGVISYFFGVSGLLLLIGTMLGILPFNLAQVEYPGAMSYVVAVGLMLLFALQHTIMTLSGFKAALTKVIPEAAERMTFMFATGTVLWILFLFWPSLPTVIWNVDNTNLRYVLYGVAGFGWVYLFLATFAINHFELFGLQQSYFHLTGRPLTSVPFKENLMYKFDRHPIMTGVLIGTWATPEMTLDHLLFSAMLTVYIIFGVSGEERKLRAFHGQTYNEYAGRVRTLIPTFLKG